MPFMVTQIVDGDTFDVDPNWKTQEGLQGSRVRIAGFDAPEIHEVGGPEAKKSLADLIQGRVVELEGVTVGAYGRLIANVFLNGQQIVPAPTLADLLR